MTRSLNVTPNTIAHLTARSDKSVAYVTNNKRLYSTFCTVEANYLQTRSIARPLCDRRATCEAAVRDSETAASRIDDVHLFVRLSVCLSPKCKKRDFLKKTKQFRATVSINLTTYRKSHIMAFQRTHHGTPKIQDGGDSPSWTLTPKCKNSIFSKTKQFKAMELWCLLTTYMKLCKLNWAFSKNPLLDPYNPRWLRYAILKIDMT